MEDCLTEDAFFAVARDIISAVFAVYTNNTKKDILKALAISVFRSTFDILDTVKDEHGEDVKGFADEMIKAWTPYFLETMKLPPIAGTSQNSQQPEEWRGQMALKVQVVKTLMKIRSVFPQLLLPQSPILFSTTWEELKSLASLYEELYIKLDVQGRLEDSDGLPYSLDFLVLEDLDFFHTCIKAPPVQRQLEAELLANSSSVTDTPWVMQVMDLTVKYAQIPNEDELLWDIDVNLFLAEETSVTANYNARAASGDLLIKLGEWLNQGTIEGLLAYTKVLFANHNTGWREKEAALFLLTQLMNDFMDIDKAVASELIGKSSYDLSADDVKVMMVSWLYI